MDSILEHWLELSRKKDPLLSMFTFESVSWLPWLFNW